MTAPRGTAEGPSPLELAALLARRERWLRTEIQARLSASGHPNLTRAHATLLAALGDEPDGVRPGVLARRLAVTGQAINQLLAELCELDAVVVRNDPVDRRAKLLRLSQQGSAMAATTEHALGALQGELAERVGPAVLQGLIAALRADWGVAGDG